MVANSVGYAGLVSVVAVVGLLASEVLGRDLLAGLPAAAATLGTALAATPLALRSKRRGRRRGLWLGYFLGAAGGVLAMAAGQLGTFWLLILAMGVFGVAQASNLQARFAAADLADPDRRARAISMVVWVGTVGAVLGPPAALWANRVGTGLGLGSWVSPLFLGILGFGLAGLVIALGLRPDPLELAGGVDPGAETENPLRTGGRAWTVVWNNAKARLALLVMAVSQMAMVAVMTMTPLHMRDHGHAELSTLVISMHVLGMFGLSPLIGGWADRFGRIRSVVAGAAILGVGTVSCVVAGYIPGLLFAGLFLLGLGWSFALIAGSALLTESLPIEERVGAQGLADVAMSLLAAVAAFGSGFVKETAGFHWLANFATIAAVIMIAAAMQVRYADPEPVV
jgi:MFS family permease